ncbi:MAG: hypothetical protein U5L11_05940 [Arhodomonas sp.]|nr:hypothetical protein [Arhodomonas sp.]
MNRFGLFPENDPYQQLRLKRFLMATLVYGVAIGLKAVYAQQGLMAWRSWAGLSAAILVVNLVLFAILRSGRNERLRDPSLTAVQMVLACLLMMATLYLADGARGALLLLYLGSADVRCLPPAQLAVHRPRRAGAGLLRRCHYGAAFHAPHGSGAP